MTITAEPLLVVVLRSLARSDLAMRMNALDLEPRLSKKAPTCPLE